MTHVDSERGAAAVEFALVSMLLVTLLMGIMEFGYVFFMQGTLAGSAREGARVLAITGDHAAAKEAAVRVASSLGVTKDMVTIPSTACRSGATTPATVSIDYPHPGLTKFFFSTINLHAEGTMRCNG